MNVKRNGSTAAGKKLLIFTPMSQIKISPKQPNTSYFD